MRTLMPVIQTVLVLGAITLMGMGSKLALEDDSSTKMYRQHISHCVACQRAGATAESFYVGEDAIPAWHRVGAGQRPVVGGESEQPTTARVVSSTSGYAVLAD